jgi:branched-subunit amino acid transport protein
MNRFLIILGMAVVTYVPRLGGIALNVAQIPPFWRRFLRYIPISVFAALIVPALPGEQGEVLIRLVAASMAGLVTWRTQQMWAGILVGMGAFWILRLFF